VRLFVLSPEIEDRDEVEVATGQSTKRPSFVVVKFHYVKLRHILYQESLIFFTKVDKSDRYIIYIKNYGVGGLMKFKLSTANLISVRYGIKPDQCYSKLII
jgi:hypothetical protein